MDSETLALSPLAAQMSWLHGQLPFSHCLTFQSDEKHFRPLKAAVNVQHWLQNLTGITGTLISHHSTPFYFQLFKIYQTLHLLASKFTFVLLQIITEQ